MKIYVFGTRGFPGIQGGVEKHCEYLYTELSDQYNITVFRRKSYLPDTCLDNFDKIHFIDLPSTKVKGVETFIHSLLCALYCLIKRPDIVHIHNIGPGMFTPLLRLFGLKVVLTYHSPNYEHKKWNYMAKQILKLSEWLATHFASAIIFVNKKQMMRFNHTIQQKSSYIPNGVHIKPILSDSEYIKQLGLIPQEYILCVGRITQEKGFDYLIDAFIKAQIPNLKLVIAGGIDHKSDYAERLLQKARQYQIIMPGYTDGKNLQQLYSHARLFVLPSYNEGFPLVLLEAMSYRLPLLASNIEANLLLKLNENDYFKVGNVLDLAQCIQEKTCCSFKQEQYQLKEYTWKNIGLQVKQIYRSLK
ncbi:glycosyltransferase family 4 protein [Parabacteroides sp.]